jgi:hypothetical protein
VCKDVSVFVSRVRVRETRICTVQCFFNSIFGFGLFVLMVLVTARGELLGCCLLFLLKGLGCIKYNILKVTGINNNKNKK